MQVTEPGGIFTDLIDYSWSVEFEVGPAQTEMMAIMFGTSVVDWSLLLDEHLIRGEN